jgi:hypothetical protein
MDIKSLESRKDFISNHSNLFSSLSSTSSCCSTPTNISPQNHRKSPIRLRFRFQRYINFSYLLPFSVILLVLLLIYVFKDSAKHLIFWIERQNLFIVFVVFLILYILVSFPITVGYLVLIISSGYIFGLKFGLLTTVIGANLGVFVANIVLRSIKNKLPIHR